MMSSGAARSAIKQILNRANTNAFSAQGAIPVTLMPISGSNSGVHSSSSTSIHESGGGKDSSER